MRPVNIVYTKYISDNGIVSETLIQYHSDPVSRLQNILVLKW